LADSAIHFSEAMTLKLHPPMENFHWSFLLRP